MHITGRNNDITTLTLAFVFPSRAGNQKQGFAFPVARKIRPDKTRGQQENKLGQVSSLQVSPSPVRSGQHVALATPGVAQAK